MPVSDREIWTAADLIIKRLGAEARREAVQRAGDMLVRGLQLPPTGTKH